MAMKKKRKEKLNRQKSAPNRSIRPAVFPDPTALLSPNFDQSQFFFFFSSFFNFFFLVIIHSNDIFLMQYENFFFF